MTSKTPFPRPLATFSDGVQIYNFRVFPQNEDRKFAPASPQDRIKHHGEARGKGLSASHLNTAGRATPTDCSANPFLPSGPSSSFSDSSADERRSHPRHRRKRHGRRRCCTDSAGYRHCTRKGETRRSIARLEKEASFGKNSDVFNEQRSFAQETHTGCAYFVPAGEIAIKE